MPFEISVLQLPGGARCARVEWTGLSTGDEARDVVRQIGPGGQYQGLPVLVVTQKTEFVTPEARAIFGAYKEQTWLAFVVTNPVIRVATRFVIRMNRNPRNGIFATEADALRWLDERTRSS